MSFLVMQGTGLVMGSSFYCKPVSVGHPFREGEKLRFESGTVEIEGGNVGLGYCI